VHPDLTYVRARVDDRTIVVADALLERLAPGGADILARFAGADIAGTAYEPPFPFIGAEAYGAKGHTVLAANFVSADDGTGLVHTAIAFGEDDFRLGEENGLAVVNPVRLDGTYDERIGPYAGRRVEDADPELIEDLRERGRLFRAETIVHAYPHCWRSGTPLIYYAKPSWYIATTALRGRLLAANESVTWHPEHVKHGRFGNWLENNVDWALSRERYWGTPLPVWRCPNDHVHAVGSFDELEELAGIRLEDPHRPFVDEVGFPCPHCHERMERVPEVIDVWFDSGAMPYARLHAPHEKAELFGSRFPADFVCEGIDQTRGWFYSLLAEGALLFDSTAFRNVVCLGLITDAEGRKMSKSLGNSVEPWEVLERFGADALRWYFFTSKQPWDGYRFSFEAIGESVRLFLRRLWNVYHLYALYFEAGDVDLDAPGEPTELDRWIESRLAATVRGVDAGLDGYDATAAGRALAAFIDDLSNWYVRRSRRRFWDGEPAAFRTLRACLVTTAKLLAPFCPFVADEIYDNLDGERESVHGCDFPVAGERDERLEEDMAIAREAVRLGHAARGGAKLKVRQPLRAAVVVADDRERAAIERLQASVREELNVRELRFVSAADELGSVEVKPNFRSLGPRFGRLMPEVARAVAGLDPAHVTAAIREGRPVGIMVDGHDHELGPDDLLTAMRPLDGYQVEREGGHAVALELALDGELRREGLAREIVHAVQAARKAAGLDVSDRIVLTLGGDAEVLDAARAFEAYLAGETLAVAVSYDGNGTGRPTSVEGRELTIGVERSQAR
jgi:isoleucyl-tRNA synthetase